MMNGQLVLNCFVAYLIFADTLLMTLILNLFHKCPYLGKLKSENIF